MSARRSGEISRFLPSCDRRYGVASYVGAHAHVAGGVRHLLAYRDGAVCSCRRLRQRVIGYVGVQAGIAKGRPGGGWHYNNIYMLVIVWRAGGFCLHKHNVRKRRRCPSS